ncbi:hypothetical protein KIPE111705_11905 [Kibdelosporangium persicum]
MGSRSVKHTLRHVYTGYFGRTPSGEATSVEAGATTKVEHAEPGDVSDGVTKRVVLKVLSERQFNRRTLVSLP